MSDIYDRNGRKVGEIRPSKRPVEVGPFLGAAAVILLVLSAAVACNGGDAASEGIDAIFWVVLGIGWLIGYLKTR